MDEPLLTRTSEPPRSLRPSHVTVPYLYLVLDCDRPATAPLRFCLADAPRVELGRGGERGDPGTPDKIAWAKDPEIGLRIQVPDRCMSSRHAVLAHDEESGWVLRDLGSKNGTFVDGAAITEARLADGALIELGHSFFLFRLEPAVRGGPSVLDATTLTAPVGLRTLVPALDQQFASLTRLAASPTPLLLLGETGTGKEVVARSIHELSRRPGAFVGVNCGAIADSLVESELFGSKKGAFSGANEDRPGLVRASDGGTLLLDEIGDLPLSSQAALLRTLQEGEVLPVGAARPVPVDLRVLAATHHDLDALVRGGRFRADLLARLGGFTVRLPPLRERIADFGLLLTNLAARLQEPMPPRSSAGGASGPTSSRSIGHTSATVPGAVRFALTTDAARAMLRYHWPMNVRELQQDLRAALVLAAGANPEAPRTIGLEHLPERVRTGRPAPRPKSTPRRRTDPSDFDERRAAFIEQMKVHRGNVSAMARALGTARMQIHRWIRQYGVDPEQFRGAAPETEIDP